MVVPVFAVGPDRMPQARPGSLSTRNELRHRDPTHSPEADLMCSLLRQEPVQGPGQSPGSRRKAAAPWAGFGSMRSVKRRSWERSDRRTLGSGRWARGRAGRPQRQRGRARAAARSSKGRSANRRCAAGCSASIISWHRSVRWQRLPSRGARFGRPARRLAATMSAVAWTRRLARSRSRQAREKAHLSRPGPGRGLDRGAWLSLRRTSSRSLNKPAIACCHQRS